MNNEHMQVSLLLGGRKKGNFVRCFHSFLPVFEKVFCRKPDLEFLFPVFSIDSY